MKWLVAALMTCFAIPASAQVVSRPAEPPIVTAENDDWFRRGEPLFFAGAAYYPAGAAEFFNGNVMVRTGHYNGVPLYADTTLEPYSVVFVPIGRGLMQPYERLRDGELAGTAGSRTPSFPVRTTSQPRENVLAVAGAPVAGLPPPDVRSEEPGAVGTAGRTFPQAGSDTAAAPPATPPAAPPAPAARTGVVTAQRAQGNDGIWLQFMGERWVNDGSPVPLRASEFVVVGAHAGFPVYARKSLDEDRIYLPAPGGLVPFALKQ
jgi:hypothetical protein